MCLHACRVVSQQNFFIGILVLFTGCALTLKCMCSSFVSVEMYVNSLCSIQLAPQGSRQDRGVKSVENCLNTLFFISCPNSNAACRNYRENTEFSVFLFFCFLLKLFSDLWAAFVFLRKQVVDIPRVSQHPAKQYIGNHFVFQWLEQHWNYYLLLCNRTWLRCTDFVAFCRNDLIFLWIELQILVWGCFFLFVQYVTIELKHSLDIPIWNHLPLRFWQVLHLYNNIIPYECSNLDMLILVVSFRVVYLFPFHKYIKDKWKTLTA